MSTATETTRQSESANASWQAGIVSGIAGALVMGALMYVMNEAVIAVAIPSLYTLAPPPNAGVGMFVHVSHGAVLGLVFAAIVGALDVNNAGKVVGLGIVWGVATWAVFAALIMPLWLSAVGSPASPPFPNFAMPSLLWHAVYGLVLGSVYVAVADRL